MTTMMNAEQDSMGDGVGELPGMPVGAGRGLVKHGVSTGVTFERERRADADALCALWLEDPRKFSMRALAVQFGCSQNTVREVLRGRGLLSVDAVGARVREVMDAGLLGLATRVADDVDAVPNSQVPMLLDVLARNRQLLAGGPTEIVESRTSVVNVDAWNERLLAARSGAGVGASAPGGAVGSVREGAEEGRRLDEGSVIEAVLVGSDGEAAGIGLGRDKMRALPAAGAEGGGEGGDGSDRGE